MNDILTFKAHVIFSIYLMFMQLQCLYTLLVERAEHCLDYLRDPFGENNNGDGKGNKLCEDGVG